MDELMRGSKQPSGTGREASGKSAPIQNLGRRRASSADSIFRWWERNGTKVFVYLLMFWMLATCAQNLHVLRP